MLVRHDNYEKPPTQGFYANDNAQQLAHAGLTALLEAPCSRGPSAAANCSTLTYCHCSVRPRPRSPSPVSWTLGNSTDGDYTAELLQIPSQVGISGITGNRRDHV